MEWVSARSPSRPDSLTLSVGGLGKGKAAGDEALGVLGSERNGEAIREC